MSSEQVAVIVEVRPFDLYGVTSHGVVSGRCP
jgi:hypothetical protein